MYMQADLCGGKMYHAHGRKHENAVAGKPDAVKAACPVWWGAHGTGPSPRWYLAGCLPNGDISQCFDKLSHELVLSTMSENIHDGRFIKLLRELLDAGYMEDWTFNQTLSGVPQGGIVSPVLSNILLDKLDKYVETVLIPRYTKGVSRRRNQRYANLMQNSHRRFRKGEVEVARALRRQAQSMPTQVTDDPDYRRLKYVRYADDVRHLTGC
jgi:retron-type reverse transcriptase